MGRPSLGRTAGLRVYLTPTLLAWLDEEVARLSAARGLVRPDGALVAVSRNEVVVRLVEAEMRRKQA